MTRYRCVIADDEPIAREIVEGYCKHLPQLEVIATCANALEAKAVLEKEEVDILFLDINMPVLDGIAFLKTVKEPPQVIFTTAYKEFAVNAFDLSACDYLLKPFSIDRFIVAVDKAISILTRPPAVPGSAAIADGKEEGYTFIRIDSKIFKVQYDDILYAEASGNYTRIVMKQQTLLPAMTFTAVEQQLPGNRFIRVHRSFIINKAAISHIEGNRIFIGRTEIPIGSNYKESFLKELGL